MARLGCPDGSMVTGAVARPRARRLRSDAAAAPPAPVVDPVPWDCPGAVEIGFAIPERYNASDVLFDNLTASRGDHIAVTGSAGTRSYAQLAADAARWGNALLASGLVRGDRVLLVLDDTPIYPAAFFGAVRAGLVPILINLLTPPDLLRFYLADSQAKAAVIEAAFCDRFDAAVSDSTATSLQTLFIVDDDAEASIAGVKTIMAQDWLRRFPKRLRAAETHRNDMAFWMYSSGSTGRPKGIVHLHYDMPYTHASYGRHMLKLAPNDVCFSAAKIFYSYGFGNSITFPFSVGATSVLMPGRTTPDAVLATIARYRPSVFFGVPTLFAGLVDTAEVRETDLSPLRLVVSAAEMLSAGLFGAWKAATGREIVDCLGATEMLNVYISNTPERKKAGAAGMRVPGYEIVLKDEAGAAVEDGREGVLWIRGHSSTPLFWNDSARTADVTRDCGWWCTGDRFMRDEDGFFYFRGRSDDLVKISGHWVNPIEVQCRLAQHPAVRECVVLAVALPDGRKVLKAFVVMSSSVIDAAVTRRALQDFIKDALAPFKYPRAVEFLAELPRTGTGKIDRQALLQRSANPSPPQRAANPSPRPIFRAAATRMPKGRADRGNAA